FSTSAMPLPNPREGSSGVDGVLAVHSRPVAGSSSVTSVNVPPVSMPTIMRAPGCFGVSAIRQARRGSHGGGRAWTPAVGRGAWRPHYALGRGAGIDEPPPGAGRMPAGDAPGRMLDTVDAHGDHGFRRQHLQLADEAAAAAPAAGPASIGVDGIADDAHGEHR